MADNARVFCALVGFGRSFDPNLDRSDRNLIAFWSGNDSLGLNLGQEKR